MRRIHLAPHLSTEELEQRYRASHDPTERSRRPIIWLLSKGLLAREVAESTGYSAYWIGQIARRYNTEGAAGMVNRRPTATVRRPTTLLSSAQLEELRQALRGPAPQGLAALRNAVGGSTPPAPPAQPRRHPAGQRLERISRHLLLGLNL